MDILTAILLIFLGAVISIIGAVLGIGAGFIIVPILVLFFKIPMHNAIVSSLVLIIAISVSVSRINIKRGFINIKLATVLELFAILGACAGASFAVKTDPAVLRFVFSVVLTTAAIIMLKKSFGKKTNPTDKIPSGSTKNAGGKFFDIKNGKIIRYGVKNIPIASITTLMAGGLSGLTGIGGGIINVPTLNLICGLPIKAASATSNYMLAVTAAAGAVIYTTKGYFAPQITLPIVIGVILASAMGAKFLRNIKSGYIEKMFAVVLIITAVRMFFK